MKLNPKQAIFYAVLIAIATLIKVVCAPRIEFSGTTGIIAIALFAGFAGLQKKQAFLLPLFALIVSNLVLEVLFRLQMFPFAGFYKWQFIEYTLLGFAITAMGMLFSKFKTTGIVLSIISGPTIFFLVSNFIVWYASRQSIGYANNFKGLLDCYAAGVPFYRNSILSTAILLPVFVAANHWVLRERPNMPILK